MKSIGTFCAIGLLTICATNLEATAQENWAQAGTGMWHNCPITEITGMQPTMEWAVTFEQSSDREGLYRTAPYGKGWPLQATLGTDPAAYAVIDATDPNRVYIAEFSALGIYTISQLVAENGWAGRWEYGTLTDGCITFPAGSFSVLTPLGWQNANLNGTFSIDLPDKADLDTPTAPPTADALAPIETYTLQGIRITRPTTGQPIILRQGSTVTKTIAR